MIKAHFSAKITLKGIQVFPSAYTIFGQGSCIPFKSFITDLCRHPTLSVLQSSTYKSNIASLVIDGDKITSEKYCAHTEVNRTKAWLQIDQKNVC